MTGKKIKTNIQITSRTIMPIVVLYATLASLWIIGSDQLVAIVVPATPDTTLAQTFKGLAFVLVTTLILWGLLYWQIKKLVKKDQLLREQELTYRTLVDNSTDFIVRFDAQLRHLYVNPALVRATGIAYEDYIGKTNTDLGMPAAQVDFWDNAILDVFATQQAKAIEFGYETVDGYRDFYARLTPEIDEQGRVKSVLSIVRDVTDLKQATQKAQQNARRLQGIIDSQLDLFCRYTPNTTLTFVNDAYCEHFGKTRQELLGHSFLPLGGSDQENAIRERVNELLQNPQPGVRVFKSHTDSNTPRWIQWVDYGITNADGEVVEIQAVGRDITAQKQSELELQRTSEVLQTIIDNIPIMIAFFDQDGRFQFVNQHWVERLGWTAEELRRETDPLALFYPDPDYRQEVLNYMLSGENGWRDFHTLTKENGVLETTWANVRLSDGRSIGIGRDVTASKKAERALKESEERLRRAIEEAPFPIIIHAEDGQIQMMSQTLFELTGYRQEQLNTVHDWTSLAYGDDHQRVENIIDKLFELDSRVDEGEFIITCHDGSQRIWQFSTSPLGSMADGRRLVISMASDVTLRKQREEELESRTAELERFTYTVSHDLKSPLITIQGFIGLLEQDIANRDAEGIQDDLTEIRYAVEKMQELLADLLELSRVGRLVNPSENIPAQEIINEALKLVEGYQQQMPNLTIQVADDFPTVYGDRQRLVEVFQNLIENAMKFSGKMNDPRIEIGIIRKNNENVFFVEDNGIGIPDDYHDKVFELFERLDPTSEGTGIGLALVKRIIEFHNGRVWVESKGVNQGSTFYFTLPYVEDVE